MISLTLLATALLHAPPASRTRLLMMSESFGDKTDAAGPDVRFAAILRNSALLCCATPGRAATALQFSQFYAALLP